MKFYVLKDTDIDVDDEAVTDYEPMAPINRGQAAYCMKCNIVISGLSWLPPYNVELTFWGNIAGDIAFFTSSDFLISEKFLNLFKKEGLSGLSDFKPVNIINVIRKKRNKPKLIPKYFFSNLAYSGAAIDHEASGSIWNQPYKCDYCRVGIINGIKRVVIEPGSWTGEDIFKARGLPGTVITSERFKDFIYDNNLSNARLINTEMYSFQY